ncbi:SGNH/GDSL hydrolase family protein [Actinoplanes sp. KI2]|uniref:SGNH/GDSL hydrolase family protein n=1 Tax=Actinoplanes sp. KI2 TaxID=2983315 RepID=UPI0021D59047|nr:SGNH/GDSL hydrolase family protein [Actinoplanes sp. KI2]MCU7728641.1 SGNH/GDSL hydrolase family protein [Actinoplanes sp. KI2]
MRRPLLLPALLMAVALLMACDTASAADTVPSATPGTGTTPSVVTLGDSVAAGAVCGCDPFPALYAKGQHAIDVNLAESGATASDMRDQLPGDLGAVSQAAQVVIMIGANDVADTIDDPTTYPAAAAGVQSDVTATIADIEKAHTVPVIVLGYWNVVLDGQVGQQTYGPNGVKDAAQATSMINNALQAAASTNADAEYISTEPAFHGADGTDDPTDLLASDGDHPNAAGQAAIAALLPPLPAPSTAAATRR